MWGCSIVTQPGSSIEVWDFLSPSIRNPPESFPHSLTSDLKPSNIFVTAVRGNVLSPSGVEDGNASGGPLSPRCYCVKLADFGLAAAADDDPLVDRWNNTGGLRKSAGSEPSTAWAGAAESPSFRRTPSGIARNGGSVSLHTSGSVGHWAVFSCLRFCSLVL